MHSKAHPKQAVKTILKKFLLMAVPALTCASAFSQKKEAFGSVSVISSQPVRVVIIDDSTYVNGDRLAVPAGAHRMVVPNPDRIHFQKKDFVKDFELRSGEHVQINVQFEDLSEINSYPMNASVLSGQINLGGTPLQIPLSDYRNKILQFKKTGYEDGYVTVDDSMIQRGYVTATLAPKVKSILNNENEFVNLQWKEQGPNKHKIPLIVNTTLGVGAGAVAAYYKHQADLRFEKAKLARRDGDTARQDKLTRQTHRYDRYAAIGFVAMQVNMIALIYFLLKSK